MNFLETIKAFATDIGQSHLETVLTPSLGSGNGRLPIERSIQVYRGNSTAAYVTAIQSVFPICQSIVGEPLFIKLAKRFVWREGFNCDDLNAIGEGFGQFLGEQVREIDALGDFVYLQELASLEYAAHRVHYELDDDPFDLKGFSELQQRTGEMQMVLSHSLSLLEMKYPVFEIWRRHRDGESIDQVESLTSNQYLVVYRREFVPEAIPVGESHWAFLKACQEKATLGEMSSDPSLSASMGAMAEFIQNGWIQGFSLELERDGASGFD